MPSNNHESSPSKTNLNAIVEYVRDLPQGLSGPSPKHMTEYASADTVWEGSSEEVQRLDDQTGLLDGITNKVNKYLSRVGEAPSDGLNEEIAQKMSTVVSMLDIDPVKKPSKTEQIAIERLVLNFSDKEVEAYLGDELIETLQKETGQSAEMQRAVPAYFSQWERLRRAANDRDAYAGSIRSVQAATAIAENREEYLRSLGVSKGTKQVASALSPYNLLTLTTISPESYDTVLTSACRAFARAEEQFPNLARQMPEEVMTIILRRGGSGKKQVVDEEKLFAYLARKNAALERTANNYVVRAIGGATPEEAANRAGAVVAYGKVTSNSRYRDSASESLTPSDFRAVEYGADFGKTLAIVAHRLSSEQLPRLLEKVARIRQLGDMFAEQFDGYDGSIKAEVNRAIGERVTEALYVVKYLTEANGAVSARVLGGRITVESIDEVMDALDLIDTGLTRIVDAERSGIITNSYDEVQEIREEAPDTRIDDTEDSDIVTDTDRERIREKARSAWHLGMESDVLVQVKTHGERRGEYRRGIEHSEEAQINYSVDVTSRDGEYVPISIANYRRRHALSIRLDLEGTLRDANGGKAGFDATREQLTAALDLGSLRGPSDNPNVRVARIVSLGNKLRKRELQQGRSFGYHTSLSSQYGHKEKFAELARFKSDQYRSRVLGRGAVVASLGLPSYRSSASQPEKAVA